MTFTILFGEDKPFCCSINHEHYINEALNKGNIVNRLKEAIIMHKDIKPILIARFLFFEFSLRVYEHDNWLETGGYVCLDVTTTQDRQTSLFARNLDIMSADIAGDITREIKKVIQFAYDEGPVIPYTMHRESPCLDN